MMKTTTLIAAVILMTFAGLNAQVDLTSGLVASYPFSGNADDASGNGNDGTVMTGHANWGGGTPVLAADRFGNADMAYYFNEGGHIEVPYSTILNPSSMSISWWVKMEEQANNDYMISMSRWNCYKVNLQDINRVFFTTKVENPETPGEFIYSDRDHDGDGLVADTWYHLTVSFGAGHMMFYIDGVLVKDWDNVPDASILDISANPVSLTFGQDLPSALYADDDVHNVAWGGFFKGTMDDIRIYNRILNAGEVTALFMVADVDLEDGLVAAYPFKGNADDASGNGNDGTVMTGHTNWGGGTPVLATDRFGHDGQAYYFNEGGHIEVPYSTILNPSSMSISWWIKMEEQANNDYMISMSRWNCYKVNLQDINRVFFTTKVENPETPGEFIYSDRDHDGDGLVADTWYHLAVSFGMGHMMFYIDGELVKDWDNVPDASILDISADPVSLTFGQDLPSALYADDDVHNVAWGGFFKGTMDDIMIYNRVLSADEVMAIKELEDDYVAPPVPGLVASYPFDGNADDASGNGNDGAVMMGHSEWGAGTPVLTSDRFGVANKAYYFNEGGNIEVPYSTILNPSSMSISWWVYMEEQANNDYMISMSRWNCFKVNLQDINRVFFTTKVEDPETPGNFIYNDRDHDGDGLMADTWYHLTVSFGVGHMKFYINGELVKDWDNVPDASILDISNDPVNLTFGQDLPTALYADDEVHNVAWGGFFKGKMDDIQIYNYVLSAEEVTALFGNFVPISIEDYFVSKENFELKQNYPNPFSSSTTIEYSQKEKGFATLKVFNSLGQEVVSLLSKDQNPGTYKYTLDASGLSSGIYFYQLSIDGIEQTKKLHLNK